MRLKKRRLRPPTSRKTTPFSSALKSFVSLSLNFCLLICIVFLMNLISSFTSTAQFNLSPTSDRPQAKPGLQNAPSISGRKFMDYSSFAFSNTNPTESSWKMECNRTVSLNLNCCNNGTGPEESKKENARKALDFGKILN